MSLWATALQLVSHRPFQEQSTARMSDEHSGETKPKFEEAFHIVVKDQANSEIQFKVKPSTKFGKIMASYAANRSIDQKSVRFLYDGRTLQSEETPASVGMESEDVVDAVIEQIGGSEW
ncbi:hypothetical protein WJX73_009073 [Symbiochloris irregularis]|uniref:Small ubiquitin-related modifier n=1 Tax=Symbiochloris irregularis TaxID=706552 RepID=A0AAW1PJ10_9CHLO